jgi:5-methylcytosine-specific restriction endonuclease McrA
MKKVEIKCSQTIAVELDRAYIVSANNKGFTVFVKNGCWYQSRNSDVIRLKAKREEKAKGISQTPKPNSFAALHPELYVFDKRAAFAFLIGEYGRFCFNCKSTKELVIDHIVPRRRGGTNDLTNLQLLCKVCNFRKGLKIIDYRLDCHEIG